jgi:hypothetical protein
MRSVAGDDGKVDFGIAEDAEVVAVDVAVVAVLVLVAGVNVVALGVEVFDPRD